MSRFNDIDPNDIDPETGRPYPGYSSPSLDTSMHDNEMAVDPEPPIPRTAKEIVEQWEAEGLEKTSLYWRLKQLAVEGK